MFFNGKKCSQALFLFLVFFGPHGCVYAGMVDINSTTLGYRATGDRSINDMNDIINNQHTIQLNQGKLATNQRTLHKDVKTWVGSAISKRQMEDLLLDSDMTEDGYDNLVDQLQKALGGSGDVQPSFYQEEAVNLFQSAAQSGTMAQSRSSLMTDFVSLILSGAGNTNASESLLVSDVLPSVPDPSDLTISTFNSTIFPYVQISTSSSTGFEVSTCSSDEESKSGASQSPCNLMKSALYTQALTTSCSSSYASSSSSSSTASSSTSTSSQASASSYSSGPTYDKTNYPSGFSGGCSALYYQTEYNSWNGWNSTLDAILAMQTLCSGFQTSDVSTDYQGMTANILNACTDYNTVVSSYDPKTGVDNSSIAQDLMADLTTPIQDIIKYTRRLLVKQMFDFNMKSAISVNQDMAYYGSLYTLIGPDRYQDSSSSTSATSTSSSDGTTSVTVDMTPSLSQDCVSLFESGDDLTVSIDTEDTDQSKLANLLIQQIAAMYPIRTVLPTVSFPKPSGSSAVLAINGQLVALNSDGYVMASDSSATTVQVEQDVSQISSAQSTVQSSMITANQLFQAQMDSYLKAKATAVTPLMEAYADRFLRLKVSNSSSSCSLTPAELNRYAATWRLNPKVKFVDANPRSASTSSYSWLYQISTANSSELSKEMASLQAQNHYMKYQLYSQNEKLGLIGTLGPLQQSSAMALALKSQSAMLDKLVNDYVSGSKLSSGMSSNSAASSASS